MLSLARHTQNKLSTRNPRHSLSINIKFWRFKTPLCNHHSPKPGYIPGLAISSLVWILANSRTLQSPLKVSLGAINKCLYYQPCFRSPF